nr:Centromere/kinetochore protein zw10 [Polyrhizophydium stewartii]
MEIESDVETHQDAFRSSFAECLDLTAQAQALVDAVDAASSLVDGPEGLLVSVESTNAEIRRVTAELRATAERQSLLNELAGIKQQLDLYDDHLLAGRYKESTLALLRLNKAIKNASLLDAESRKSLQDHCQTMQSGLEQTLDHAISSALSVTHSDLTVCITLLDSISFGTGVPDISTTSALASAAALGILQRLLKPFVYSLNKHLLVPLADAATSQQFVVVSNHPEHESGDATPTDKRVHKLVLAVHPSRRSSPMQEDLASDQLHADGACDELPTVVYGALARFLAGFLTNAKVPAAAAAPVLQAIGGTTLARFEQATIDHSLVPRLPAKAVELQGYIDRFRPPCAEFVAELDRLGIASAADSALDAFFRDIEAHFGDRAAAVALAHARTLVTGTDFDTVTVGAAPAKPPTAFPPDPLLAFPRCSIRKVVLQLTQLLDELLGNSAQLGPRGAAALIRGVRDMVDFSRSSVVSVLHSPSPSLSNLPPHLAMVLHNDCMWLAHWCMLAGPRHSRSVLLSIESRGDDGSHSRPVLQFVDLSGPLTNLAKEVFRKQQRAQQANIDECFAEASGFDCLEPHRVDAVQRAFRQVIYQIRHIHKVYAAVLPARMTLAATGQLVGHACANITAGIQRLPDIGQDESATLAACIETLGSLRSLFVIDDRLGTVIVPPSPSSSPASTSPARADNAAEASHTQNGASGSGNSTDDVSMIAQFTDRHFAKCVTLGALLNWNLARIMEAFRAGDLRDFGVQELAKLIRALFSDTPLRERSLAEIARGHPMILPQ